MLWDYKGCKQLNFAKVGDEQKTVAGQDDLNLDSVSKESCPQCSVLEIWSQNLLVDPSNTIRAELAEHRAIRSHMEEVIRETYAK